MAVDGSVCHTRGKILLKAQEVTFAKALAGNNGVLRDRAVRRLKKWIAARSKGNFCFDEDDLMRVWKGLYHCMWMSDKPLVQEGLAENIAELIHAFATAEEMTLFVRCFYRTMLTEWVGIDQLRLDKYLMLVRRVLRQALVALRRLEWAEPALEQYNAAVGTTVLAAGEPAPAGLVAHYCTIFLEELAKIGGEGLGQAAAARLMAPAVALWSDSRSADTRKLVMRSVLDPLIAQHPVTGREDARFQAWVKAGFPGKSMDDMEIIEQQPAEGEESVADEADAEFNGLDPRAGSDDVVLPSIAFDASLLAEMFSAHLAGKTGKAHVSISRQMHKFERLSRGLDPIARRHRMRDVKALPLLREAARWRSAKQWQSAVELHQFDPDAWKATRFNHLRKNKFQGTTEEEIFADFLSKQGTPKDMGAAGKFTVQDSPVSPQPNGHHANGHGANGEVAARGSARVAKKRRLSAGEWTVTASNGSADSEESAAEPESAHGTPGPKAVKPKAQDSGKKQTPLVKSSKKQPPPTKSSNQTPAADPGCEAAPSDEATPEPKPAPSSGRRKLFTPAANTALMSTPQWEESAGAAAAARKGRARVTPPPSPAAAGESEMSKAFKTLLDSSPLIPAPGKKSPLTPGPGKKSPLTPGPGKKSPTAMPPATPIVSGKRAKLSPADGGGSSSKKKRKAVQDSPQIKLEPMKLSFSPVGDSKTTSDASEVVVPAGRRLCLNVVTPAPALAPAKRLSLAVQETLAESPASPTRSSLRIAQKVTRVGSKTPPKSKSAHKVATPSAVEVLRTARAALGSPGSAKRVNIALARNEAQEVWEYHAALESSPGIPFDAARRPPESALKPGAAPSPINPFYRRRKF